MLEFNLNEGISNFILDIDGMNISVRCDDILFPIIKSTSDLNIDYIGNEVTITKKFINIVKEEKEKIPNNRFKFTNIFRRNEKTQPIPNEDIKEKELEKEKEQLELIIPIYDSRDTFIPVKLENISMDIKLASGDLTIHNMTLDSLETQLDNCKFDLKKGNIRRMVLDNPNADVQIENGEFAILEITSDSGEININNAKAVEFDVEVEKGNINLKECTVTDNTITRLETGIGNICINNSKFDNLMVTTFTGDIQIEDTTQEEMTMHCNSSGFLTLKRIGLEQLYSESYGGVIIEDSKIPKATISTLRGDLTLQQVIANDLNINIDSGNVNVTALDFDKDKVGQKQVLITIQKGNITLENLKSGYMQAITNNGVLDAKDIDMGNVQLQTNAGYLELQRAICKFMKLKTMNGLIDIRDINAGELMIHVDSDDIYVEDTKVDLLEASTTEGRVFVENLETETAKLSNDYGEFQVEKVTADSFAVKSDSLCDSLLFKNMKCKYLEAVTHIANMHSNEVSAESIEFTQGLLGKVTLEKVTADSFDMSVDEADVYINDMDSTTLNVDVTTGSVDVSVLESLFNFKTELNTKKGNIIKDTEEVELPSVILNPKNNMDISTNDGNIKVLFKGKLKS